MRGFLARTLITALGLWLASAIVPGITITGVGSLLLGSVLLGFVNAFVRPVVVVLTLPITLLTLGIFLFIINAGMLAIVAGLLDGFQIAGFFSAAFGAVIVSLTSTLASWYVGPDGKYRVIIIERHN